MFRFGFLLLSAIRCSLFLLLQNGAGTNLSNNGNPRRIKLTKTCGNTTVSEDEKKINLLKPMMDQQVEMQIAINILGKGYDCDHTNLIPTYYFTMFISELLSADQCEIWGKKELSAELYDKYMNHYKKSKSNLIKLYKFAKKEMGKQYFMTRFFKLMAEILEKSMYPDKFPDGEDISFNSDELMNDEQNVCASK